ncbi:MAG: response regulator [Prolixibacteraceae bacterium]|nr:response regulator [Prolixibacteraceae bacterium]
MKGKILYVDDEADNLTIFSKMLLNDGYHVDTATNSKETDALLEKGCYDILLLDIGLKNESGLDILKKVKSDPEFKLMMVVMITGLFRDSDQLSNGLESGADGYLTRPIKKREFLARINAFMRHRQTIIALEKSETRFKKIIDRNPDAILIVENNGHIKFANPAAEKMFQLSIDYLLNQSFGYPLISGEHTEINIVRKTTDKLVGEMRTIDIDWDDTDAFLTSIRDITELKKLLEELVLAREKAEENDKLKSAFLANMSHEIRTPMNGILGFAELLKESELSGEDKNQYLGIIQDAGERMLSIINNIIDVSKIESGQMEVSNSEININDILKYIFTFFKPQTDSKSLRFSYETEKMDEEITIVSDREKIYAILTNLIRNAIKFCDSGEIKFGYKINHPFIEFFVADTGSGIPKNRLEAIFERFIQADIENIMAKQGSGLGLAISKAYVEMLGGNMWVESTVGKGSTFNFSIPMKPGDI